MPPTPPPTPETTPTVSVVIPTYNREHLLSRSLDSVLAQTFTDFEVLVVDDGSTDGTAVLMAEYEARDGRIRYLSQPRNAGVSAARNRGLREARGDFIAFLDSDDEWFPTKLERQITRFKALPGKVGLLYGGVENLGPDKERMVATPTHRGRLYPVLLKQNVIHGTSGVMLRRAAVRRAGFFDEVIPAIEDWDYWLRVTEHFEVDFVPEPLIRYHDPEGVERKSLDTRDNMEARAYLYDKYSTNMRRAGVAHLFLLESARRYLAAPKRDARRALQLTLRAALVQPLAYEVYPVLFRALLPPRGYQGLRIVRRRLRRLRGART